MKTRIPLRALSAFLRGFAACNRGVTAIEFAVVSPVALIMLLGTMEVSIVMLGQSIIESATANVSRLGKTGYVAEDSTREATLLAEVARYNSGVLNTSDVSITALAYDEFSAIGQPEPYVDTNHNNSYDNGEPFTDINANGAYDADQGVPGYGDADDVVVYTLTYPWKVVTPFLNKAVKDGTMILVARMVVKNEPYDVDWMSDDVVVAEDESGGAENDPDANGGGAGSGSCNPISHPGTC